MQKVLEQTIHHGAHYILEQCKDDPLATVGAAVGFAGAAVLGAATVAPMAAAIAGGALAGKAIGVGAKAIANWWKRF